MNKKVSQILQIFSKSRNKDSYKTATTKKPKKFKNAFFKESTIKSVLRLVFIAKQIKFSSFWKYEKRRFWYLKIYTERRKGCMLNYKTVSDVELIEKDKKINEHFL